MQDHEVTAQIWDLTYTQICKNEGFAEFESFWYIARDYESAAKAT